MQAMEDDKIENVEDGKHHNVQAMLPWGFESKLASVLACIKIPFIIICAVIGFFAEHHLKTMTIRSWDRPGNGEWLTGTVTGCYAHELMRAEPSKNLVDWSILNAINNTFGGRLHGDVWTSNVTVDPFHLQQKNSCQINIDTCQVQGLAHPGFWSGGLNHWLPFAGMWLVYKVVFVGIHPIDRLVLKLYGNPQPGPDYPEPLMKLLTEPYFQTCTTLMQVVVKFLFYFRYKMMPNTLLGALASMQDMSPHCPRLVHYTMSPRFGNTAYYLCAFDLISLAGMYWYCKVKMDRKLVGRWRYRIWKVCWFASAILCGFIAVNASLRTFGGLQSILMSMFYAVWMTFSLNINMKLNVDLLKVMTFLIFFFEFLELSFMVISILGPKVAPQFFARFKWLRSENDYETFAEELEDQGYAKVAPSPAAAGGGAKVAPSPADAGGGGGAAAPLATSAQ